MNKTILIKKSMIKKGKEGLLPKITYIEEENKMENIIKDIKCSNCDHCERLGSEYRCDHPKIEESALKYEEKGKKISRSIYFIGWRFPKTKLRWCPRVYELKENKNEKN